MGCRALNLVAAPILDPDARLRTDLQAVQRQMRALERLGEESPRAMFFASSGRLMLNVLHGRIDASPGLIRMATAAAERAALSDAWMVLQAMDAYSAAQSGDTTAVGAEAAYLWVCAHDLLDLVRFALSTTGSSSRRRFGRADPAALT